MKKISKEFWLSDNMIRTLECEAFTSLYMSKESSAVCSNKIIITYEKPEKKIEISEGELFDAIDFCTNMSISYSHIGLGSFKTKTTIVDKEKLKQKLLGKTE